MAVALMTPMMTIMMMIVMMMMEMVLDIGFFEGEYLLGGVRSAVYNDTFVSASNL